MSERAATSTRRSGRVVWGVVAVLAIAHHDAWNWSDATLVLGFLPVGLAYHVLISLAAAAAWVLVVRFAWPEGIEEWASAGAAAADDGASR